MTAIAIPVALAVLSLLSGVFSGHSGSAATSVFDKNVVAPADKELAGPQDWYADTGGGSTSTTDTSPADPQAPASGETPQPSNGDLQPVPEPTTLLYAFLGSGLGTISLAVRRRRR